jgi:hypothetical protein
MRRISKIIFWWRVALMIVVFSLYLGSTLQAADVTLAWDANTDPDLAGYTIHYKTASSGPPYNGTGATEGSSPIDVGNVTEFTTHGLASGVTYFFAATAYDTEGLESGYSNEVSIASTATTTIAAGEEGGCFVATADPGSKLGVTSGHPR